MSPVGGTAGTQTRGDTPLDLTAVQHLVIAGERRPARDGATFTVRDPATARPLTTVAHAGPADVDDAVAAARAAFDHGPWPRMRASDRGRLLTRIAALIRDDADRLAMLETRDVGKPLREARQDVETAARYFEFYGGVADKAGGATIPLASHLLDYTVREPIGVSGQIIPFNYPMQNAGRGAGPALAVGCTVVLKPSPEAPLSPLAIAGIAARCGLPPGVLNVVPGADAAGAALAAHPGIDQVTFTGSVPTGIAVARAAAGNVVPSVLELGGKSPSIVFADADPERTVPGVIGSVFGNAGQTCSAGSRLLLQRGAAGEEILRRLIGRAEALRLGPGADDPDMGPLVSAEQRDRAEAYIADAVAEGATVLTGGTRPSGPAFADGHYLNPTIIEVGDDSARIAQEEVFGPVLTVLRFDGPDDAARIANGVPYGLSSYIWTRDIDIALDLAGRLRVGQVNINPYDIGTGAELPFGGVKHSGWGREKGLAALDGYTQVKNVCIGIKRTGDADPPLPA